jgi:hypothetical protein
MHKLSPSALSLMKDCSRCFWFHYKQNKKRPEGIFPSLPNGMDNILKTYFDKFIGKGILPLEMYANGECKNLKLFDNETLLKKWRNNLEGISYADEKGNILHGAIDSVLTNGEKLVVLDFKTRGFPLKKDTPEYYRDQLDIYNFLFRKNGHETEDYSFLLFYYPKEVRETGEVVFNTNLVKMDVNISNAENLWKRAIDLLNGQCPEKTCDWCEGK